MNRFGLVAGIMLVTMSQRSLQAADTLTLTTAAQLDRLSELVRTPGNGDTLFLLVAPGDYYLERTVRLSAGPQRPVVVRAADPERKPRLIGGKRIEGWESCGNGVFRAPVPEVERYGFSFEQFYVDGHRAIPARTPNEGWFYVKGSKETPYVKGVRAADYAVQRIDFNEADWQTVRDSRRADLSDIKFRFYHKWDNTSKPASYIVVDSTCIYTEGAGMKGWNPIRRGSRYFMYDYRAALDMPGEWYLDRREGYLYYMPREGEDLRTACCIAPALTHWLRVEGREGKPVEHITFEGLSFQYAAYRMPAHGEEPSQAASGVEAGIRMDYAGHIRFVDCELLHTGGYALWMARQCHYNEVRRCLIADLGAGGIKVGEPSLRPEDKQVTSHNTIDNNIITSAGHVLPCGVGVALFHTADNNVTHNEISDLLYSGVSIGWVWGYNNTNTLWTSAYDKNGVEVSVQVPLVSPAVRNTVSYNHIHHIGWGELSDMGAVYTLGESPGTRITHNVIHHVQSYDYGGWGLYTDEGSTGVEMSHNLVYACKSGAFHQHYGKENRIENNVLALSQAVLLQCTRAEKHISFFFRNNVVLTDGEALFAGNWKGADIRADRNLYWNLKGDLKFGDGDFKTWKRTREPHSVWADPGFRDPVHGDFTLTRTSAVRRVGYEPWDFSQAGVYGTKSWRMKAQLAPSRIEAFAQMLRRAKEKK